MNLDLDALTYDERGLLPVVAQDQGSGAVLMVAWADREALARTLETGQAWFWSRSRGRLWKKGESSGNVLDVVDARADCDGDTVLLSVRPRGPACHTGARTCFGDEPAALELGWLAAVVRDRRAAADEEASYTARLFAKGVGRMAQKVGEEGVETALAAVDPTLPADRLAEEAADLLYHLVVLLEAKGVEPGAVARVLAERHAARTGGSGEGAP